MHTFGLNHTPNHIHTHTQNSLLMMLEYYFLFQTKLKSFFFGAHSTSDYNELVILLAKVSPQNRNRIIECREGEVGEEREVRNSITLTICQRWSHTNLH